MILLTDKDFLQIEYKLPDMTGTESAAFTFNKYAEKSVEKILRDVLGHQLYQDFVAGLAVTPTIDIEERWLKLRDGELYEYSGRTYAWYGMKECLKPYVWCMWTRHNIKQRSKMGYFNPKVENAESTDGIYEMVTAYNDFAAKVGSGYSYRDSLYGYLKAKTPTNALVFTDWYWRDPGFMNEYGL